MTNQILLNNVAGSVVQNNIDPNNPNSVPNSNLSNSNINNSNINTNINNSNINNSNINNSNQQINNNQPSFILTDNSPAVSNPSFGQTSNRITNTNTNINANVGQTVSYGDANKNSIIQPLSQAQTVNYINDANNTNRNTQNSNIISQPALT